MYYKLDENKNVVPSSLEEWEKFIVGEFPSNYRHVGDDIINGMRVSTVFIGLCYDFFNEIPRVFGTMVFETMVFDDGNNIYCHRYCTWKEAEEGHKEAIEWVKNGCK